MNKTEIDAAFGPDTYDKMMNTLNRFRGVSTVWLVTLREDGQEQTIYVIVPKRQTAVALAKIHSELTEPKLKDAHKHILQELEPAEIADFNDKGIAVFEPESED